MSLATPQLERAYADCHEIVAARAKNFSYAFLLLPPERRRAIEAVYAYCRLADDLADDEGLETADRARRLALLRQRLAEIVPGARPAALPVSSPPDPADAQPADAQLEVELQPLMLALRDTCQRFGVRHEDLDLVAIGCEQDLTVTRYATFKDLHDYCYMVASAVGLACLEVFGYRGRAADVRPLAADLGVAMQLTNVIRDVAEDMERDRIYLPQADLERFGVSEEQLREGIADDNWRRFAAFQVGRARDYFARGRALVEHVFTRSRVCPLALASIYEGLLDEIERRDYDVFSERISLSGQRKLGLMGLAFGQAAVGGAVSRLITEVLPD